MFFFKNGEYVVILAFTGGEGVFGIFGNDNALLVWTDSIPAHEYVALVSYSLDGNAFALGKILFVTIAYVLAVDLEITVSAYPCAEGDGLFFKFKNRLQVEVFMRVPIGGVIFVYCIWGNYFVCTVVTPSDKPIALVGFCPEPNTVLVDIPVEYLCEIKAYVLFFRPRMIFRSILIIRVRNCEIALIPVFFIDKRF